MQELYNDIYLTNESAFQCHTQGIYRVFQKELYNFESL